jgi:Fe-S-cluster containining protein
VYVNRFHDLFDAYRVLLEELDIWFSGCVERCGDEISCCKGCSACCRGLFDISLLDAGLLQAGFLQLDPALREQVLIKARRRVSELQAQWPEFQPPYILNRLPHEEWQEMPEDDLTPCPLLSEEGQCLVYAHRPMICRLHGLPNIDSSGESFSDAFCSLNFTRRDPLPLKELRYPFRTTFEREFALLEEFAERLLGVCSCAFDTFIPSALLIDFS